MDATLVADRQSGPTPDAAGKYLTFALGREEYGVPVLKVREIIQVMDITPVPQMPPHVRGVINLRGKVIPVVDLRACFGLDDRPYDDRTCIIVVQVTGAGLTGIAVDAVSEVIGVNATDIDPAPDFGERLAIEYVVGLAKLKGTVKILLDLDQILGASAEPAAGGAVGR